jgi:hypothetical protein
MRDLIWTIIIVWLVWKIWEMLKSFGNVHLHKNEQHQHQHHHYHSNNNSQSKTTDRKNKIPDSEGEYVEFEEFKK